MDQFEKELEFEQAVIDALQRHGWAKEVLHHPTEEDLIGNWAKILYDNNQEADRLNHFPLVREEMDELLEQIRNLRTPHALNGFINGYSVSITRRNPDDKEHFGKEVSLRIYDRMQIAAGNSVYQIAEQPVFQRREKILQDRRGDLLLLINGMPVFHVELKRSGVPVQEAVHQIQKYAHEGIYTGILALVQIFVAMNPEESLYFANPGPDGSFQSDFHFHWADFNNEPVNDWKQVVTQLLCIPMAHQLIGFYTVADDSDGVLKVMRSYQYHAVNQISDRVKEQDWEEGKQLGGYVWHTTGSGKTMTSFKSAQLIANSKDADKVIFLMDRIELGTQSLAEYRGFADDAKEVQGTEDTRMLLAKLKSRDPKNTLIVSSIQKMSRIREDEAWRMRKKDLEEIQGKRLVFIVDECHRSTFGEMLTIIKETFPRALFFGFTGTPVFTENGKKALTTADIFGNELHRYSIADGIRDQNVLGFDPTQVFVYQAKDLRKRVALHESGAASEEEALSNEGMRQKYYHFLSQAEVPMAGVVMEDGSYRKGIEDYVEKDAWQVEKYQKAVVKDIADNWMMLSRNSKFHGIFATSSIPEAIRYYQLFKEIAPNLKVTGLFDPTIDNKGGEQTLLKEDGLVDMLQDYNARYDQNFDISRYPAFKKDVAARLAHKKPYERLKAEEQLDLLIVVNQMLTGFDSKWVNSLYLDKELTYQNLIQAFSRTNRLFHLNEKPFGSIRYYRKPYTMKRNIEDAVKLYSGDRPQGLFADHLLENIRHMNFFYEEIRSLFDHAGIPEREKLPEDTPSRAKFARLFREWNQAFQAAKIQGFRWEKPVYTFVTDPEEAGEENPQEKVSLQEGGNPTEKENLQGGENPTEKENLQEGENPAEEEGGKSIRCAMTKEDFDVLLQRYKELRPASGDGPETRSLSFPLDPYLTEMSTGMIDHHYMNSRFEKWKKELSDPDTDPQEREHTLEELHRSFAYLSQEEQKFANLFLHDVQTGDVKLVSGMTFSDYIVQYAKKAKNDQIDRMAEELGLDRLRLTRIMETNVNEKNLNEYGRFDQLKATVVRERAQEYFSRVDGEKVPPFLVNNRVDKLLTDFITSGGFDL